MSAQKLFYVYLSFYPIILFLGIINFRNLDKIGRLVLLLVFIAGVSEALTRIINDPDKKNSVYHFYSIIEISIMTSIFLETIQFKNKKTLFLLFTGIWLIIGLLNILFFQSIYEFNSNVLMLEGFAIIGMAIYVLYSLFISDKVKDVLTHPHFWLWSLFLLSWTSTFFFFPFVGILAKNNWPYLNLVQCIQVFIDSIVYCGIGLTFLFYHKMVKK
jgi:hypothetical protein